MEPVIKQYIIILTDWCLPDALYAFKCFSSHTASVCRALLGILPIFVEAVSEFSSGFFSEQLNIHSFLELNLWDIIDLVTTLVGVSSRLDHQHCSQPDNSQVEFKTNVSK